MTARLMIGLASGLVLLVVIIGAALGGLSTLFGSNHGAPSQHALADIPTDYLRLYARAAATDCPGLPWTMLAAIGKVESDHGRSTLPGVHDGANAAGAQGPMQFLPATFAAHAYPIPPGGADPPSPFNPVNAIHAAARYLCASGAPTDLHTAIWAYNHADWYVARVLAKADSYQAILGPGAGIAPTPAAAAAVDYALGQLGLPYVWGGDGGADGGFDCSGLTAAAYAAAGIQIPRTAHTQYLAGPLLPANAPIAPGDLIFYGTPARVHHVALYIGNNTIVHAPTFGQPIQLASLTSMTDRLAASRPGADSPADRASS